jgi:uncharacterized protein
MDLPREDATFRIHSREVHMPVLNRRSFLRHSIVATGAAAAIPSLPKFPMSDLGESPKTVTRVLGRTGIRLPVVSVGVERSDAALVKTAVDSGVIHLDTAHTYVNGKNEVMLGGVLKDYPRSSVVVSTKVHGTDSTESFLSDLNLSLKRLQMDSVDILYLHNCESRDGALSKLMLDALREAKESGRTRFLGVSVHRNEPEVIRAAIEAQIYDVVMTSYNYKQEHAHEVADAITEAGKAGLGIVAMKTMAGGFLDKERTKPVNCKAALKWVLQHEYVTTCIPSVTTFDQLKENLSVNRDILLTEEEKKALLAYGDSEGSLYCDGCGRCQATCPHSLPLHDFMRAYMYTYGYGSPQAGQAVVRTLRNTSELCNGCDACTGVCKKGIDVKNRMADVARLRHVPEEFLA